MIRAKDRTIDVYKRVGAEMRLLKSILSKVTVDVSKVLTAKMNCSIDNVFKMRNKALKIFEIPES